MGYNGIRHNATPHRSNFVRLQHVSSILCVIAACFLSVSERFDCQREALRAQQLHCSPEACNLLSFPVYPNPCPLSPPVTFTCVIRHSSLVTSYQGGVDVRRERLLSGPKAYCCPHDSCDTCDTRRIIFALGVLVVGKTRKKEYLLLALPSTGLMGWGFASVSVDYP